ncbi:hypothetical protein GCM10011491_47110 [Brucella endophytica]|uniref:Insertion element IS402-like domain-containing protein n=1 Tax=Brucella endophytica TaxID=1963359 RepID=A0A916SUK9_9HYPH|nr:hypothetical protein GCM10011491_47110 [Brucella endophytica]
MWTVTNRARYNRDLLRYPSDLTDEEWALIEPLIPPGKKGGGKRRVDLREVVNGLMYVLSTAANGGRSRRICRRARQSMTISTCGRGTTRSIAFMKRFMSPAGNRPAARHPQPPPLLTARASKARKKGALDRPAWLRCRQNRDKLRLR